MEEQIVDDIYKLIKEKMDMRVSVSTSSTFSVGCVDAVVNVDYYVLLLKYMDASLERISKMAICDYLQNKGIIPNTKKDYTISAIINELNVMSLEDTDNVNKIMEILINVHTFHSDLLNEIGDIFLKELPYI